MFLGASAGETALEIRPGVFLALFPLGAVLRLPVHPGAAALPGRLAPLAIGPRLSVASGVVSPPVLPGLALAPLLVSVDPVCLGPLAILAGAGLAIRPPSALAWLARALTLLALGIPAGPIGGKGSLDLGGCCRLFSTGGRPSFTARGLSLALGLVASLAPPPGAALFGSAALALFTLGLSIPGLAWSLVHGQALKEGLFVVIWAPGPGLGLGGIGLWFVAGCFGPVEGPGMLLSHVTFTIDGRAPCTL